MKRILAFFLFTSIFTSFLFAKTEYKPISVFFDDGSIYKTKLAVIDGAGYLNAKDVAKYYSADLNYRGISSSIELKFAEGSIVFFEGKDDVLMNGVKKDLNKACCILNKEFYIPLGVLLNKTFWDFVNYNSFWDYNKCTLKIVKSQKAGSTLR